MIYLKITEWDGFVTTPMPLVHMILFFQNKIRKECLQGNGKGPYPTGSYWNRR